MASLLALPDPSGLPRRLLLFLDDRLGTRDALRGAPSLAAELGSECDGLERDISREEEKLASFAVAWAGRSDQARQILRQFKSELGTLVLRPSPDGNGEMSSSRVRRMLGTELPLLAKELGRIEMVRRYAETTLHLEALMGDLEDAALSLISQNSRNVFLPRDSNSSCPTDITWKQGKLFLAIKTMEDVEKILVSITEDQMRWTHLLTAVDLRVERILAILRPQALISHRSILASVGWPPPITTVLVNGGCCGVSNPLVLMKEEKKEIYSQSFLALVALQVLQANRERRKHNILIHQKVETPSGFTQLTGKPMLEPSLWTVDELVYPIASRVEHHFSRWSDQPELMFALTYRITRDLIEGVDNVLQPLIDKARLVSFSAKESWISAMVRVLTTFLEKRIFPDLARKYYSDGMDPEVISSWLNLIELIITFDKKMQALASSGILLTSSLMEFDGISTLQLLSIQSLFCDHSEWIEVWAQIELKYALDKLKDKLEYDEAWTINIRQETELIDNMYADLFTFSSVEDYKAPLIADSVIKMAWTMIERGWTLPSISLQTKFVRSSANVFLHEFSNVARQYCQEFETMIIMGDDSIRRVASVINAARYCESVMLEWSENVNFLEMSANKNSDEEEKEKLPLSYFFADEIKVFCKLETDCLLEIISALLLEFNSSCYNYIQSSERWGEGLDTLKVDGILDEQIITVSYEFVEALDMLKDRFQILKQYLNMKDFLDLWVSVAGALDHFIFRSILLSNVRVSSGGISQFKTDMLALFLIFKPFCIRPESFFPCISDSLKLFSMCREDVNHLMVALKRGKRDEEFLHHRGLFHVSPDQAEKILSNRIQE